jgi:hypothetical protein
LSRSEIYVLLIRTNSVGIVSKRVDIAVSAMLCVAANAPVGASWLAYICLVPWMISVQSAVGGAVSGTVLGTAVGFALGVWIPVSLIS